VLRAARCCTPDSAPGGPTPPRHRQIRRRTGRPGAPRGRDRDADHARRLGFWSAKTSKTCRRQQIHYSITVRQTTTIRAAIATIAEDAWVGIAYPESGVAQVAETRYRGDRLVVRRTRLVGEQAQPFPTWRFHAFVTDRVGTAVSRW
jgi:hypothetical protein